jgi:hypothetical protein
MARTIGSAIAEARAHIQDTVEPYRYLDADMVQYFNDALAEIRRIRPDFFIGALTAPVDTYLTTDFADPFPLDDRAYVATTYFVAGSASLRDDEHELDNRTTALLQAFTAKLTVAG